MVKFDLRSRVCVLASLLWTFTLVVSLLWTLKNEEQQAMDMAYAEARANLNKDITFRRWGTMHGGVYVPITATQQSVPWLSHVPGRDVTTTDGRKLTLLNPASMLRQIMDSYAESYGIRGRITGLRYLNPGNAPDSWERQQLESFDRGERKEVWEVAEIDGAPYLRYLRAMFMEPGCDKCHGILGYKTGDMRGATGLNLPLKPYLQQIRDTRFNLGISHAVIWLIGLGGILWVNSLARRWFREQEAARAELQEHRQHLEELVAQRTAELRQTEARAELILNSSADGLFGLDIEGKIIFINPAACHLLGCTADQAIGRSSHALFHHSKLDGSPYPACDCPTYRVLHAGQGIRVADEVYWRLDGRPIPVMYATHPIIEQGKVTGAVTSFVDLSAQQAAARARESALMAAENLARVRSEFVANMSHEIRTPLNGVLGFADLGYRNYLNSDKARDAFAKIKVSGKRLLGVVNDILDFSKIEAGKLALEKTEVFTAEVINQAIELVRDRAEAKQLGIRVALSPDLPQTFTGDSLRLGQVLINVLTNAVKFTEQGGVTVSASLRQGKLVFRVVDTGIGMSESQQAVLYAPFQQADASSTRKFGGTGLGLAISKRIMELMLGDMKIQSELGGGTTVEFWLPYSPSERKNDEQPPEPGVAKPLAGISVLVAEDECINQEIIAENLIESGARVVTTSTGREAVDQIHIAGPDAFDVVLMDIQMPEMDGYEAARQILELAPNLPIIAQTAHALKEERDKCLAAGMIAHITKPINPDDMVSLVQRVLAKPAT